MNVPYSSAMILAGGKSSRMGVDKADLPWGKITLLEHIIQRIQPLFSPLIVVTGAIKRTFPGVLCVQDQTPDQGPLGGILSGFPHMQGDRVLAVACDMPFLQPKFLEFLWHQLPGHDAVVPVSKEKMHPLCAVYSASSEFILKEQWNQGERSMHRALKHLKVKTISEEMMQQYDPDLLSLENMNTPEDQYRLSFLLSVP